MTRSAKGMVENPGQNVKAKAGLNRAILRQGWSLFVNMLEYKLAWNGGLLVKVPPRHTSQTCSVCEVCGIGKPAKSGEICLCPVRTQRQCRYQCRKEHTNPWTAGAGLWIEPHKRSEAGTCGRWRHLPAPFGHLTGRNSRPKGRGGGQTQRLCLAFSASIAWAAGG